MALSLPALHFTNIPELDFTFKTEFQLVNTPNITGDPVASADQVTIGNFGYTFNVFEGDTASVDVMATLSTSLVGTPSKAINGSDFNAGPLDPSAVFVLESISFANPSAGGFVTNAPETGTSLWLLVIGLSAILPARRQTIGGERV
jgi:hypothetical protein